MITRIYKTSKNESERETIARIFSKGNCERAETAALYFIAKNGIERSNIALTISEELYGCEHSRGFLSGKNIKDEMIERACRRFTNNWNKPISFDKDVTLIEEDEYAPGQKFGEKWNPIASMAQ